MTAFFELPICRVSIPLLSLSSVIPPSHPALIQTPSPRMKNGNLFKLTVSRFPFSLNTEPISSPVPTFSKSLTHTNPYRISNRLMYIYLRDFTSQDLKSPGSRLHFLGNCASAAQLPSCISRPQYTSCSLSHKEKCANTALGQCDSERDPQGM
jgi:hypothetical protein